VSHSVKSPTMMSREQLLLASGSVHFTFLKHNSFGVVFVPCVFIFTNAFICHKLLHSYSLVHSIPVYTPVRPSVGTVVIPGAVSLTYLSILKEGFTPIFSATLAFLHKKTGVSFPICLGKRSVHNFSHSVNMAATLNITLWKC